MKKTIAVLLSASIVLSLTACGGSDSQAAGGQENSQAGAEGAVGTDAAGAEGAAGTNGAAGTAQADFGEVERTSQDSAAGGTGGLQLLATQNDEGCHTKDGYYYYTFEPMKLSDGNYGLHLMYMDFQALQEVYLCSNAGCSHDSVDCTAVLPYDSFYIGSTLLFTWQDSLYLLSKRQDDDGSMAASFSADVLGSQSSDTEGSAAVLYRANLDGTGRETVHMFDPSLTLEDLVMGDDSGIYVVTKKLTSEQGSEGTYFNSAERKLVHLDLSSGQEQEVCSLDFDSSVSWRLAGCYDRTLVLKGIDYGREVSGEEIFSDDGYKDLYENSQTVFATVALDNPQLEIRFRQDNKTGNYTLADKNMIFASNTDGSVTSLDLRTGAEKELCRREGSSYLYDRIGDKLRCDSGRGDRTFDFIDVNTGEVSHSSLVNQSLGWSLEFRAVLDAEVLTVYDYDYIDNGDGSYEITRYQYGLISQEDLFAGNANFRKINMTGKGE